MLREVRSQRLQLQPGPGGAEHEHSDRRRSAEGGGKSAFVLGAVMSAYPTWSRKRWMVEALGPKGVSVCWALYRVGGQRTFVHLLSPPHPHYCP